MSTQLELKEKNASRGGARVGLFIPFPEVRRVFPRETSRVVPAPSFCRRPVKETQQVEDSVSNRNKPISHAATQALTSLVRESDHDLRRSLLRKGAI